MVQSLMDRGRKATEQVSDRIQNELVAQIGRLSDRLDSVERTLDTMRGRTMPPESEQKAPKKPKKKPKGKSKSKSKGKPAQKQTRKPTKKPASKKPEPVPEPAPATRTPVGSSGVGRVPTTRAARDAG